MEWINIHHVRLDFTKQSILHIKPGVNLWFEIIDLLLQNKQLISNKQVLHQNEQFKFPYSIHILEKTAVVSENWCGWSGGDFTCISAENVEDQLATAAPDKSVATATPKHQQNTSTNTNTTNTNTNTSVSHDAIMPQLVISCDVSVDPCENECKCIKSQTTAVRCRPHSHRT